MLVTTDSLTGKVGDLRFEFDWELKHWTVQGKCYLGSKREEEDCYKGRTPIRRGRQRDGEGHVIDRGQLTGKEPLARLNREALYHHQAGDGHTPSPVSPGASQMRHDGEEQTESRTTGKPCHRNLSSDTDQETKHNWPRRSNILSPILLPRMTATSAEPILAELTTSMRIPLTWVAVKSETKRRLKVWRQLVEEMRKMPHRRRVGLSTDLFLIVSSSLPLKEIMKSMILKYPIAWRGLSSNFHLNTIEYNWGPLCEWSLSLYLSDINYLTLILWPAEASPLSWWILPPGLIGDLGATAESLHIPSCPPLPTGTAVSRGRSRRNWRGRADWWQSRARQQSEKID